MSQAIDFLVLVVPGRVRVAVRLRPWNAEETITYANFADCVELQTELKRLKLRKNNWNSDTYEFDEVFTESASQKRVYEVVAKPVVEAFPSAESLYFLSQSHTSLKMLNFCKLLIFIFLVSTVSLSSSSNAGSEYSQAECLKVTASSFMSSLKTTVDAIQQVVPVISKFANFLL
ncbi:hypothetical protein WN944_010554 [Citrus x changshan-huyou]|uniref:Kinesin motor domain-containing protein n=1 Tax=Citrus x changshan-huyou TaxID=2935761 RepID=A0AAP0MXK3_9ROSI